MIQIVLALTILAAAGPTLAGYPTGEDLYGESPGGGDGGFTLIHFFIFVPSAYVAYRTFTYLDKVLSPVIFNLHRIASDCARRFAPTKTKLPEYIETAITTPFAILLLVLCTWMATAPARYFKQYSLRQDPFYALQNQDHYDFCQGAGEIGMNFQTCEASSLWIGDHYPAAVADPYPCQDSYGGEILKCLKHLPYVP